MKKLVFILFFLLSANAHALTEYYVDPDFAGGTKNGQAATPWSSLDAGAWSTIDTALASGAVTVYFSALATDGTTQETYSSSIWCDRTDKSSNRLTLDGHGYYNTNDSSPSWSANPTAIGTAYTTGKVFKLTNTGFGIGWGRTSDEPKQDYVTVRGFEGLGPMAFAGDSTVYEYIYIHDTVNGAALSVLMTYYPDNASCARVMDPSTDITLRYIKLVNVQGEGIYIGSSNIDCPDQVECDAGNEHDDIEISNFYIEATGYGGGQGDGIDVKNGVTNVWIHDGEINGTGSTNVMGGIIVGQSFDPASAQNFTIERVYIHDIPSGGSEAVAIYGETSTISCSPATSKGYNNLIIRNNIIENNYEGISLLSGGVLNSVYVYNNTIFDTENSGTALVTGTCDDSNCEMKNNYSYSNTGVEMVVGTNWTSDYNAYYGTVTGTCGANCDNLSENEKDAATATPAGGSAAAFDLISGSVLIDAGTDLSESFTTDYSGTARPQNSIFDIGAYEFDSAPANTIQGVSISNLNVTKNLIAWHRTDGLR